MILICCQSKKADRVPEKNLHMHLYQGKILHFKEMKDFNSRLISSGLLIVPRGVLMAVIFEYF